MADPNSYVTLTVTSALGEQLTQAQVQVDSHESWSYTLSYSLTPGMTVQAVASVDKNSTPSDAYIKVINQAQSGPLNLTGIKTDKVSGVAPDTGQIIKAWRSSDGAQMVNNKVPSTGDGKTFTFNYLSNMTLADNDLLSVVSEFKDNGTMTPFDRGVVS
ncbi:MAG: hypothetical protein CML23_15675 [Rhizobiaceae bacterium]|nr:hypothetical protein [Rhizobiaceae bacterium]